MKTIANVLSKVYPGTAVSMGMAVVLAVCMTVLELNNKTVPTVFNYMLAGTAGGGVAIAASGGSSVPASNTPTAPTSTN